MNDKHSEIYAQGYQKWDGSREQKIPPWWLIAETTIRNLFSSGGCFTRFFFIIGFAFYFFFTSMSNIVRHQFENIKNAGWLAEFAELFKVVDLDTTEMHMAELFIARPAVIITMMLIIIYGGNLIAKDKAANALQIYFSKAVSRLDYVIGKGLAFAIMTAMATLVPGALLFLTSAIFTTDHLTFFKQGWFVPFLVIAYWLLITTALGSLTLFFSAMFEKGYLAVVGAIGFMIFLEVASAILGFIFSTNPITEALDIVGNVVDLGLALFALEADQPFYLAWKVIITVLFSAGFVTMLFRKINPVEVIK